MTDVGARVREAREAAGLPQTAVGEVLGLSASQVSRVESGQRRLSGFELGLLAENFGWNVRELLGMPRPVERMTVAARLRSETATVGAALARAADLVEVDTILDDAGVGERSSGVAFEVAVGRPSTEREAVEQGFDAAVQVRDKLGAVGPLNDLLGVAEDHLGIDVVLAELDEGCDGVLVVTERLAIAVIDANAMSGRQRFTLAHEIGHAVMGDVSNGLHVDGPTADNRDDLLERRAHAFAAALVMPADDVRAALGERPGARELVDAMVVFGVSWTALKRRCETLSIEIAADLVDLPGEAIFDAAGRGADVSLAAPMDKRMPARIVRRARSGYGQAQVGGGLVGSALGLSGDELDAALAAIPVTWDD